MAYNYDFEGIDNDLMIHDGSPEHKNLSPKAAALINRKAIDGFTRSTYNVYVKTGEPFSSSRHGRVSPRLRDCVRTPDSGSAMRKEKKFKARSRLSSNRRHNESPMFRPSNLAVDENSPMSTGTKGNLAAFNYQDVA